MVEKLARIDAGFKTWVEDNLIKPYNLTMTQSTFLIGKKLKGVEVVEIKGRNGKPKKLSLQRLGDMEMGEMFDEIRL